MVNTLQPRQYFPIARILPDPADTGTYYIRAVVRNAKTNATIDTIVLASQGNRIYSTNWQTPADTSGQGLFITITTEVYTDASYTVPSDAYGQEQDTFLIYNRDNSVQLMATQIAALLSDGSDVEVDYKKIKKIMEDVTGVQTTKIIDAMPEVEKTEMPKEKEIDFTPILQAISNIKEMVSAIKIEEQKETDLAPVLNGLSEVRQAIQTIHIPDPTEPTDLAPVLSAISDINIQDIKTTAAEVKDAVENMTSASDSLKEVKTIIYELLHKLHAVQNKSTAPTGPQMNTFGRVVTRT